jgi:hypothetical protein
MTSVLTATVRVPLEPARAVVMEREAREEADSYVNHTVF